MFDCWVLFVVFIGNFGDIFVGYVVKCMGFFIDRFVIVMNMNDILVWILEMGWYEV